MHFSYECDVEQVSTWCHSGIESETSRKEIVVFEIYEISYMHALYLKYNCSRNIIAKSLKDLVTSSILKVYRE